MPGTESLGDADVSLRDGISADVGGKGSWGAGTSLACPLGEKGAGVG